MMKAYLSFPLKDSSVKALQNAGVEVFINPKKDRKDRPSGKALGLILREYDIVVLSVTQNLEKYALKDIKSPKIVATVSVGLDHIDPAFFESPFIKVISLKDSNAISVAEHILAMAFALNKRLHEANHLTVEGKGCRSNLQGRNVELFGKTLGLVGAGTINRELAKMARAFNMKVLCYTRNPQNYEKFAEFVDLDTVLKESDIINVSIPFAPNLICKDKIALMKPTATFINTSNSAGQITDISALINYADKNEAFKVGLDIDPNDFGALFQKYRTNVLVSPHVACYTAEASNRMDDEVTQKILESIAEIKK